MCTKYLDFNRVGYDAIHNVHSKGVKVFVCASHELWLQQITTVAVIFKHPHVQLHRQV